MNLTPFDLFTVAAVIAIGVILALIERRARRRRRIMRRLMSRPPHAGEAARLHFNRREWQ